VDLAKITDVLLATLGLGLHREVRYGYTVLDICRERVESGNVVEFFYKKCI